MKTFFFDVGGTLLGAKSLFGEIMCALGLPEKGEARDDFTQTFISLKSGVGEDFLDMRSLLVNSARSLEGKWNLQDFTPQCIETIYEDIFKNHSWVIPDVRDVLTQIQSLGIRMVVASDADADVLLHGLKKFELYDFFDGFIISSEVRAYKPSDIFVNCIGEKYPFSRENSFFVGDTRDDMVTSRKLGIQGILMGDNDPSAQGDFHFNNFVDLCSVL